MLYLMIGGTYLLESFNLQTLASQNVMETSHAANSMKQQNLWQNIQTFTNQFITVFQKAFSANQEIIKYH